MQKTRDRQTVPEPHPGGSGPLTPHSYDQLIMSSDRTRGGFRLLYPDADPQIGSHATLIYTIEHPSDGYSKTVISARLCEEMSHTDFGSDIEPRSQKVDPPKEWAEAAWEAWVSDRVRGVQRVLRALEPTSDDPVEAGEVRHG